MTVILFSITFFLELVYLLFFVLTIRWSSFRFWPPPSHRSWQFFVAWFVALLVAYNFLLLGVLDYDSFILPKIWSRLPYALAFFIVGSMVGGWASISFPFRATIGLSGELITRGPYRYSRNPQYIGDSLNIAGYVLLTNSWMVGIIGILGVVLNFLAPFTEEPWLEERFGDDYRDYKRRVPRFLGCRPKSDAA